MVNETADKAEHTDKFGWIMAIQADTRLSPADKYILQNAAITYVNHLKREDTFYVRQAVMAERFKVGLRTVEQAVSRAKRMGYLVVDTPRKRGPGHHVPDTYRLAIPEELPADLAGNNPLLPADYAVMTRRLCGNDPHGPTRPPAKTPTPTGEYTRVSTTGEVTTTGELCAFSAENAPINKSDVRLVDLEPEQEHGSLRSPGLDAKQVVDFDAELLCVRCQKNPAHFASDDQLCPDCMADAEDDRRREFSVRELFG
ncbi:hypothetical protein [Mycolicibacterium setense]|uniref:hypothetical protein n=1 Tax=Mycolicibacterium setense TaxID=431269 RepID=UPI0005744A56|nr:hypothetical protein [Mycolicibacterium setense]KHO21822.1 hypothetical protein QQ25_15110 [Mycolicibacterium setense]MCV7114008.1 hypothetical protein [Mycolicibacterium setense]